MSRPIKATTLGVRAPYVVKPLEVSKILCHRRRQDREEFLVRWKTKVEPLVHPRAICSWHSLEELARCLHLIQIYLEKREPPVTTKSKPNAPVPQPLSRKRKSPGGDAPTSRDPRLGILSPDTSSHQSRSPSVISISSSSDALESDDAEISVYNGLLEKKEGWIVARQNKRATVSEINAQKLPTPKMLERAATTPVHQTERLIREAFYSKVKAIPELYLENKIDTSTPSLNFTFIKEYVLREGVHRADTETFEGCDKPCRANMGQHIGCEYPRLCDCLEYAAVNEQMLRNEDAKLYEQYMRRKANGEFLETRRLPKRFPYQKQKEPHLPQILVQFYREQRHPIYECNLKCKCGPVCKSRVVQKGRKVPLTIFKTHDRGWGVYCNEDLIQGEFIDIYLGEVITNAEADQREKLSSKDKASYLYNLDKFIGDDDQLTEDNCYVVDGQYMGGPTRFINHCCEPNCRQYTVSYNKNDLWVYDLAFFAYEDIKAGTELTFDYMDKDEDEEADVIRKREEAMRDPDNQDKRPCNCGARKCRGFLWV